MNQLTQVPSATSKVAVCDAKGRLMAKVPAGITLDRTGRLAGMGRQGLAVLGRSL